MKIKDKWCFNRCFKFSTSAWASVELNVRTTPVMYVWHSEVNPENKVNQALCRHKKHHLGTFFFPFTEHTNSSCSVFPEWCQGTTLRSFCRETFQSHRPCLDGKPHFAHPHQRATLTICPNTKCLPPSVLADMTPTRQHEKRWHWQACGTPRAADAG